MGENTSVIIGDIPVVVETRTSLAQRMVNDWKNKNDKTLPKLVFSANGQGISFYAKDETFKKHIDQADIVHADGMSVVKASHLFTKTPLPERIATTDFFHDAAIAAQREGMTFYLLGGTEEKNLGAYEKIQQLYPDLKMVGRRNGYFSKEEEAEVIDQINKANPDVIWIALGRPKQEEWSIHNRDKIMGVTWIKTCGGLLDFLADTTGKKRAPEWMQNAGLEWLYRVMREPRRLFWRYFITNPHSIYLMATRSKDIK